MDPIVVLVLSKITSNPNTILKMRTLQVKTHKLPRPSTTCYKVCYKVPQNVVAEFKSFKVSEFRLIRSGWVYRAKLAGIGQFVPDVQPNQQKESFEKNQKMFNDHKDVLCQSFERCFYPQMKAVFSFDFETTGFEPDRGICEVAFVAWKPGCISYFHEYVIPDVEINPHALAVHGLNRNRLFELGGRPWHQVCDRLSLWITNFAENLPQYYLAHNLNFDYQTWIRNTPVEHLHQIHDYTCTLNFAKTFRDHNQLERLCADYSIEHPGPHSALGDSIATVMILPYLMQESTMVVEKNFIQEAPRMIPSRIIVPSFEEGQAYEEWVWATGSNLEFWEWKTRIFNNN
jgi:DNA polymerase III epsilon subunit-like protein